MPALACICPLGWIWLRLHWNRSVCIGSDSMRARKNSLLLLPTRTLRREKPHYNRSLYANSDTTRSRAYMKGQIPLLLVHCYIISAFACNWTIPRAPPHQKFLWSQCVTRCRYRTLKQTVSMSSRSITSIPIAKSLITKYRAITGRVCRTHRWAPMSAFSSSSVGTLLASCVVGVFVSHN